MIAWSQRSRSPRSRSQQILFAAESFASICQNIEHTEGIMAPTGQFHSDDSSENHKRPSAWDRVHQVGRKPKIEGHDRIIAIGAAGLLSGLILGTILAGLPLILGIAASQGRHRSGTNNFERGEWVAQKVAIGTSRQRFQIGLVSGAVLGIGTMLIYEARTRRRRP